MDAFATVQDVITVSGATYTQAEQDRIGALLTRISNALRYEAVKVGKDLDALVAADPAYANVVNTVTCDIVIRAMRQSTDGEPMSQESQSALGYSWSGTYAVPGGGVANSIMRNDLKRLGLSRQKYGAIDLWPTQSKE